MIDGGRDSTRGKLKGGANEIGGISPDSLFFSPSSLFSSCTGYKSRIISRSHFCWKELVLKYWKVLESA